MENNIIEIFGKKVRIVPDTEEDPECGCMNCAFYDVWGCGIRSIIDNDKECILCEDSSGKANRHFELI